MTLAKFLGFWNLSPLSVPNSRNLPSFGQPLLSLLTSFVNGPIVGCVAALVESRRAVLCYYGCILALFLCIVITLVIGIIYRYRCTRIQTLVL